MGLKNINSECDTVYISLFGEYHSEIQSLFRSTLGIKILFFLKDDAWSLPDLREKTGSSLPAILSKINAFIDEGLIERVRDGYVLTNSARIITTHMTDFIAVVGMLNTQSNEGDGELMNTVPLECIHEINPIDAFMDNRATIQTCFRSWIVAGILLALSAGEKTRLQLREVSDCTANALTPRIRWLEARGLIQEMGYNYALTPAGRAVVAKMEQFIATFASLTRQRDFWNDHSLEQLPDFALHSFGKLVDAEIVRDNPTNYLMNYEHYMNLLAEATYIRGLSTMANPSIADAIGARVEEGVPVELIISPDLACQLCQEPYRQKIEYISTFENMRFHVTELPIPMGLTVTDRCMSSKLFAKDSAMYDMQNGLFCVSPEARAWGERLFEYYKVHSIPMEEFVHSSGLAPEDP